MRAKNLLLIAVCSCSVASSEPRTSGASSTPAAQPYRAMVPQHAVAVTLRTHSGQVAMHGSNFDGELPLNSIACLNLHDGTEVIEWTGPGKVEFSDSPCIDVFTSLPPDGRLTLTSAAP